MASSLRLGILLVALAISVRFLQLRQVLVPFNFHRQPRLRLILLQREILCFFHCLNYRSMTQTIVYAGVLVICSAEPSKFNSLRQLWRILCNFACLIALGYPLLLLSFSDISLNFCGLVASRNARVLLAFISLVVFLYHRFGKVSAQPHTIVK